MTNKNLYSTLFFFLWSINSIFSCTCIGEKSVSKAFKEAKGIFVGKVKSMREIEAGEIIPGRLSYVHEYDFELLQVIKGRRSKKTITLKTGNGNGDCGFNFQIGSTYIVYTTKEKVVATYERTFNKFLYTDSCMRTKKFSDIERELLLKAKRKRFFYFLKN